MLLSGNNNYILYVYFQLLLPLSMSKPLNPVPLPQWRSAGALQLIKLTSSLDTGSTSAMEKSLVFIHTMLPV